MADVRVEAAQLTAGLDRHLLPGRAGVAGRPGRAGQLGAAARARAVRRRGMGRAGSACSGSRQQVDSLDPAGRACGWCCHSSASTRSTSPSASAGSDCSGSASTSSQRRPGASRASVFIAGIASRSATDWNAAIRARPATLPAAAASSASATLGALEQHVGVLHQHQRRVGQPHPAAGALEQPHPGLALQHRQLLGDGRGREAAAPRRPRRSSRARAARCSSRRRWRSSIVKQRYRIPISNRHRPEAVASGRIGHMRPHRHPPLRRLGGRVRRHGDLRQAGLRRRRDRRHAAGRALHARRGTVLGARAATGGTARLRRLARRDVWLGLGARRDRLQRPGRLLTSPRCGGSTPRCWRCSSTRTRRWSPWRHRARPRARRPGAAIRPGAGLGGLVLVLAGRRGALDPLGTALGLRGRRLHRLHPDQPRDRPARVGPSSWRRSSAPAPPSA